MSDSQVHVLTDVRFSGSRQLGSCSVTLGIQPLSAHRLDAENSQHLEAVDVGSKLTTIRFLTSAGQTVNQRLTVGKNSNHLISGGVMNAFDAVGSVSF